MRKTYQLAKMYPACEDTARKTYGVSKIAFGPMMTLQEAQHWQSELTLAGKQVVIINRESV